MTVKITSFRTEERQTLKRTQMRVVGFVSGSWSR